MRAYRAMSLWCAAVLLILLGQALLVLGQSLLTQVDLLPAIPTTHVPLDLSQEGVYSAQYNRRLVGAMGDRLWLIVGRSLSREDTREALEGLSALLVLQDEAGEIVAEKEIDESDFEPWVSHFNDGLAIPFCCDESRQVKGDLRLSIEVRTPATSMSSIPHCLVGQLGVTHREGLVAYYFFLPAGWLSLVLGVVGLTGWRWSTREH